MKKFLSVLMVALLVVSLLSTTMVSAASNDLNGTSKFLNKKFNLTDSTKDFKEVKTTVDELGYKHVKLQQVVNGIPVYGGQYIVHFDKENVIYAANGNVDIKAKDFVAKGSYIKEAKAIEAAKTEVGFTAGEELTKDSFAAELNLYNVNGTYKPVYVTRINWLHADTMGDWFVFVDAVTGKVVNKYNNIKNTAATGTGVGVLGDSKTINLDLINGVYYMTDQTKLADISTYNANYKTRLPGTLFSATDNIWNAAVEAAAVDAHAYTGNTYDYYYNMFGRNSIDGNGMTLKSTVHYKVNYVNAFWNGSQMTYGDGDGVMALALSGGLDIVAHEMTHGVTDFTSDLIYMDQSGALNEAYSDIMATLVEYYAQPTKADWLCGEDVWTPATPGDALRSLEDPTVFGDPAHMNDYLYTTADNGGVHTNSGIPNHCGYHIAQSIGNEKLGRLMYRATTVYLVPSSNFSAWRTAMLQSATDLYGANGTEYNAVVAAMNSVGIY